MEDSSVMRSLRNDKVDRINAIEPWKIDHHDILPLGPLKARGPTNLILAFSGEKEFVLVLMQILS